MSVPKKILVIAGGTYISGAEKVTLDVLEGLKQNGFDVHCMVSGWNDGDFINRIKALKIPYTAIKLGWYYTTKIWWSLDSLVHYPKAIFDFIRLKKNFKADLVYTISFRQIILLYPFFKKNIVYHIHDPNSYSKQTKFFLSLIQKKVNYFLAVSNYIKTDLLNCDLPEKKIKVIYNGIKVLPLLPENNNEILTIGIVGQIIPRKGHLVLIEALQIIHKNGLKVKLVIVGKGTIDFEQEIKKSIDAYELNEFVEWRGFVNDTYEIYKKIDIVIAPTQNEEPFGLMACEANMLGKPAIVSNKGGLKEIVENGMNGYLINPKNAKEIADKIIHLYKSPELIKTMGKNGRERVITLFSIAKMNESIQQLIINI